MTDSRDFPASERPEFGVHAPTRAPGRTVIPSAASSASFESAITSLETIAERYCIAGPRNIAPHAREPMVN